MGITTSGNVIPMSRIRFDNRGVPFGAFDWITGEHIVSFIHSLWERA